MTKIKVVDKNMEQLRIKKGWNLRDLAKVAKTSFSCISKIEKGLSSPRPKTAKAIADALEVEFDVVFKVI